MLESEVLEGWVMRFLLWAVFCERVVEPPRGAIEGLGMMGGRGE